VICDRYLPDAYVDLAIRFKDEKAVNHPLLRLIAGACPRPDFPVLLRLDPEQARSRQEPQSKRPASEAGQLQAKLLEAFEQPDSATVLDASRDREVVSDQLVFRALTLYFASFRTLLNTVFFANPRSKPDTREPATFPDRPAPMTYQGHRGEGRA
jgi:thymidylate kinase